jgi:hypothetical protein
MTGRLGMIVRADMGGLGNLTKSLWKHLQPDVTCVVNLPDPRGRIDEHYYNGGLRITTPYPVDPTTFRMLCKDIGPGGTLLTVETMYCDDAYRIAREEDVRTVLYAMPELFAGDPADIVVIPTPWERNRMPANVQVLAMPTDSAPRHRIRTECKTFLHHQAPAMLDRSGSQIVALAFELMKEDATLIWHAPGATAMPSSTCPDMHRLKHQIVYDVRWHDNLWDSYPDAADVMVLPRRYGGLSMPTQEAAATGLPSLMSDLQPQIWWGGTHLVETHKAKAVAMKGGQFAVHGMRPAALAREMDRMVRGEVDVHGLSEDAYHWAKSISWSNMLEDWVKLCRG